MPFFRDTFFWKIRNHGYTIVKKVGMYTELWVCIFGQEEIAIPICMNLKQCDGSSSFYKLQYAFSFCDSAFYK